jgi:glucosamine-6-phosphate deaminase
MDVVVAEDRAALGRLAAARVLERLRADPDLVLGVATGSSLVTTYQSLVAARDAGRDFSAVRCVALDEYVGLDEADPRSYHAFVRREVAVPLGVAAAHVLVPDGNAADLDRACADFEGSIRSWGGVGVQLLGIGRNGHVGFNEPGSSFASRTRQTTLSATTRADNARFFDRPEDVPSSCLTQGLATIAEASSVVLVASGGHKAEAVAAAVEGPVSEACPASILQRHPDATVILDRDAAGRLSGTAADPSAEGARGHVHSHLR